MGAFTHAPRHSTSNSVNSPSAVVSVDNTRHAQASALQLVHIDKALHTLSPTAFVDAKVLHNSLLDIFASAHHARRRATKLDEVLADLFAVEHGVKRSNFVHAHWRHFANLGDLVHGSQRHKVSDLQMQRIVMHRCSRHDNKLPLLSEATGWPTQGQYAHKHLTWRCARSSRGRMPDCL